MRLNGLPLNGVYTDSTPSASQPLWFVIDDWFKAFSLLTGFGLYNCVFSVVTSASGEYASVIPMHYNGLLVTKYRNFEKDYFTSACVDPMQGAVNVQVLKLYAKPQ